MTWQARGGGGPVFRGGGGGVGGFGGGFTPFGKQLAIVLASCFVVELLATYWLGLGAVMEWLVIWPIGSGHFAPWQLFTYPFFGNTGLFTFLFTILALYFFGAPAERYFGTGRFQTFLVVTVLLSGLTGMLLSTVVQMTPPAAAGIPTFKASMPYGGFEAVVIALLCAFGWLNPRATILLFFVLPVQAIYITYFTIVVEGFGFLTRSPWSMYHLPAIGVAYATIQKGVRLPDMRLQWLKLKQKYLKRRLSKFDVVQGGKAKFGDRPKSKKDDQGEGPDGWLH